MLSPAADQAAPTARTPLHSADKLRVMSAESYGSSSDRERRVPPMDALAFDAPGDGRVESPRSRSSPRRLVHAVAAGLSRFTMRSPLPRIPDEWEPPPTPVLTGYPRESLIDVDAAGPGSTLLSHAPQADTRYQLAKRVSRVLLYVTYSLLVAITGVILWLLITEGAEVQVWAWATALIFVNVAVPLSLYDIHGHMANYVRPQLQRYYIRCLWMVPIYAIQSWLALRFQAYKVYIETPRDAYEAYVIYSFYNLLVEALGSRRALAERLEDRGGIAPALWPFCFIRWRMGYEFLTNTSVGVFQYVFLRLACTVITLVAEFFDVYDDGVWAADSAYTYVTVIINFSQLWALYCLAGFYWYLRHDMDGLRPLGKFGTVKAIVFFSWWQGVFISALLYAGVIRGTSDVSGGDFSRGLEDFILCVETAGFAILHHLYFSYRDFSGEISSGRARKQSMAKAVADMLPVKEDLEQAVEIVKAALGLEHAIRPSVVATDRDDDLPFAPEAGGEYTLAEYDEREGAAATGLDAVAGIAAGDAAAGRGGRKGSGGTRSSFSGAAAGIAARGASLLRRLGDGVATAGAAFAASGARRSRSSTARSADGGAGLGGLVDAGAAGGAPPPSAPALASPGAAVDGETSGGASGGSPGGGGAPRLSPPPPHPHRSSLRTSPRNGRSRGESGRVGSVDAYHAGGSPAHALHSGGSGDGGDGASRSPDHGAAPRRAVVFSMPPSASEVRDHHGAHKGSSSGWGGAAAGDEAVGSSGGDAGAPALQHDGGAVHIQPPLHPRGRGLYHPVPHAGDGGGGDDSPVLLPAARGRLPVPAASHVLGAHVGPGDDSEGSAATHPSGSDATRT